MERQVRYCTTDDGVRIAYCTAGEGPALVVCPELVESFALDHLVPGREGFFAALGTGRQVIRYDARGTGLSQREVSDVSQPALVRDIEAVAAAAGLTRFALYATLASGPRAIAYAAAHWPQVSHLLLFGTFARVRDALTEQDIRLLAEMARADWYVGAETIANLRGRRQMPESNARAAELYRQSASGDLVSALLLSNCEADATQELPKLKARTLVVHYVEDRVIPLAAAQKVATLAPDARLVTLDESSGYPSALLDAIAAFLPATPAYPAGLSEREVEVLRLIAAGRSNQQIAEELVIALNTVARHVSNIFDKTGAANRAEAAVFAAKHDLA